MKWENPPQAKRGSRAGGSVAQQVRQLRAYPLHWALMASGPKRVALNPAFRGPEFERAYRTIRTASGRVEYRAYVRYVGEAGERTPYKARPID